MAKYFGIPFASTGDKIAVPDATQPDGSVSYSQGFGFDYERPNTDPGYKPVPREQTNQLYFDLTEAVGMIQSQGVADWTVDAQPYPINAFVRSSNKVWRSKVSTNNATPAEGANWTEVGIPGSETVAGLLALATTAQAQALTDDTRALTAKKLADAFGGSSQGLTPEGFKIFPGPPGQRLVLQWGLKSVTTGAAGSAVSVSGTFPLAFPTEALFMTGYHNSVDINYLNCRASITNASTYSVSLIAGAPNLARTIRWIAIGY